MSEGDWRAIASIGGVILFSFLFGLTIWLLSYHKEQRYDREAATGQQTEVAERYWQAACFPIPPTDALSCTVAEPAAEDGETYAVHDLHAQQDMALWALGVFLASMGTLFLTGVGVLLLWETLRATRETLREAKNATRAAMAAVHSERAWLSVIPYDVAELTDSMIDGAPVRHSLGVRMNWVNAGRSPALETKVTVKKEIIGPDEAIPNFVSAPPDSTTHGIPLGPGVKAPTRWVMLTDAELRSIWGGPNRLIIYTRADYKTAFDPRWRHSQATVEFQIHNEPTDEWDMGMLRHSVQHAGDQNTAD